MIGSAAGTGACRGAGVAGDRPAAAVAQVRAAGGTSTERKRPYGLMAECTDDLGTRFSLGQFPAG